jgi:hypothetical protein
MIAQGTWVKFTADARLRKLSESGHREQGGMHEGILIGEKERAVVTQQLGESAYAVFFPEGSHIGWVYNHECYVENPLQPLVKLTFNK